MKKPTVEKFMPIHLSDSEYRLALRLFHEFYMETGHWLRDYILKCADLWKICDQFDHFPAAVKELTEYGMTHTMEECEHTIIMTPLGDDS